MKQLSIFLWMIILYSGVLPVYGQNHPKFPPAIFSSSEKLPDGLLAGKIVVIIDGEESQWKEVSEGIHRRIREFGIDPIAYFHISELSSGIEIRRLFADNLKRRETRFLFLYEIEEGQVRLNITAFNGNHTFYTTGQPSWEIRASDMEQCLTVLYRKIGQSKLKMSNFLIADVPEFFDDVHLIKANRNEQFARDLKLDKMAVVLLPYLPETDGVGKEEVEKYNKELREDSIRLVELMEAYPFEYQIISYTEDEVSLRTKGFHFILYQVYNSGYAVKEYLNYKINPNETGYISVKKSGGNPSLKTIPIGEEVYKYYVKHIYTKDVYLGKDWDADQNWEVALLNYIAGLKQATGVK